MIRTLSFIGLVAVTLFAAGCGTATSEVKPDTSAGTPPDQEKIRQGMEEAMKHMQQNQGGQPGSAS